MNVQVYECANSSIEGGSSPQPMDLAMTVVNWSIKGASSPRPTDLARILLNLKVAGVWRHGIDAHEELCLHSVMSVYTFARGACSATYCTSVSADACSVREQL